MLLSKWFALTREEWPLYLAGTSLTIGFAAFAVFMIANNDGVPKVNSKEDFALFAMPSSHDSAANPATSAPATAKRQDSSMNNTKIDFTPVGNTGKNPARRPQDGQVNAPEQNQANPRDYHITSVFNDRVLLSTPQGLRMVQKGSIITGMGRVLSIENSADGVKISTENGVLVSNDAAR